MTFEFYGKKYYLRKDNDIIQVVSEDGKHLAEAYPYQEDSEKIARAILKDTFGEDVGNVALWDCYTAENFDHLEKIAKLYKEILSVVSNQKSILIRVQQCMFHLAHLVSTLTTVNTSKL